MMSISLHAVDLDAGDARLWVSIESAVVRFPSEPIVVDLVKVLSAAVRLPSGVTPFSRSNQRCSILGPASLGETAFVIEGP